MSCIHLSITLHVTPSRFRDKQGFLLIEFTTTVLSLTSCKLEIDC